MNTSLLREKILSNWKEKLVCFVMAIAVYAFYQTRRFEKEDFIVPLETRAPNLLTVKRGSSTPNYVKVSLKVNRGELGGISSADFKAYIDLSIAKEEGSYNFPVNVETSSRLTGIFPLELSVQPNSIRIEVEDEVLRYLPVKVNIPGEPAYGYEVDREKVSVNPSFIEIKGPKSQMEHLTEVQTEAVSLEGATKAVEAEVRYIDPLTLEPSSSSEKLTVYVPLSPRISTRTVQGIEVVYVYNPPSIDIALNPKLIDVTFQGEQLELDKIKKKDCSVVVNCSVCREPGEYSIAVFPEAPNNKVSVVSSSVTRVDVSAKWKPEEYTVDEPIHNRDNALE